MASSRREGPRIAQGETLGRRSSRNASPGGAERSAIHAMSRAESRRPYGTAGDAGMAIPGLRCASPGAIFIGSLREHGGPVSVRLDPQVLDWLRSKGEGRLTRINDILSNLMEAESRTGSGR